MTAQTGFGPIHADWDDEDEGETPARPAWRGAAAVWVVLAVVAGGGVLWASTDSGAPAAGGRVAEPPEEEWLSANLPPLLELSRTGPTSSIPRYEVAVSSTTGARRDAYAMGGLGGDEPAARLEAWIGPGPETASLFVELAEQASRFGASISRFGSVRITQTSRGGVEFAELFLSGLSGNRSCIGFRLASFGPAGLRGIICPTKGGKIDAGGLTCLVNGLSLTRDGREGGLAEAIKGAPSRRGNCRDGLG
jgi:hypothetical protein